MAVLIAVSWALPMPKLALMLLPIAPTEFCSRVSKNMPARISIITQNWARVKPARSSVADIVVVVAFELVSRVMGAAPDGRGSDRIMRQTLPQATAVCIRSGRTFLALLRL